MTWMDLLHLLEQQPYMELNKEMSLVSVAHGEYIDYEPVEFVFPTEFGDFEGNMRWQDWLEGGLAMQMRIAPVKTNG